MTARHGLPVFASYVVGPAVNASISTSSKVSVANDTAISTDCPCH